LISPAVKVMLFQASEEKREPTWATQKAMRSPSAPAAAEVAGIPRSDWMVTGFCGVHRSWKLAAMACEFRPTKRPRRIKATSDRVFAVVKVFWMSFPSRMPRCSGR